MNTPDLFTYPQSAGFKRDTGITLNFLASNTAEQSARLEAEARAKNVTIDILLGGGRELAPMMTEGFLQPVADRKSTRLNSSHRT